MIKSEICCDLCEIPIARFNHKVLIFKFQLKYNVQEAALCDSCFNKLDTMATHARYLSKEELEESMFYAGC